MLGDGQRSDWQEAGGGTGKGPAEQRHEEIFRNETNTASGVNEEEREKVNLPFWSLSWETR